MTLFLWDIDGTLISTGGAGRSALDRAFEELHGVSEGFQKVHFGGRTDPGIVADAFRLAGLELQEGDTTRLLRHYLPLLEQRLRARTPTIHPGVHAALDLTGALGVNALLTGNWSEGARHKLRSVDLWGRFQLGAYGDDSPIRNELVPVARERARSQGIDVGEVVVIGDTLADIACARAGGAHAVVVDTGWSTTEELRAAAPDLFVSDLCAPEFGAYISGLAAK